MTERLDIASEQIAAVRRFNRPLSGASSRAGTSLSSFGTWYRIVVPDWERGARTIAGTPALPA